MAWEMALRMTAAGTVLVVTNSWRLLPQRVVNANNILLTKKNKY